MQPKHGISEQVLQICRMGREASEAVGRILMRIDLIEENGAEKFQYFCSIDEIRVFPTKNNDIITYELRPEQCICSALIRVLVMTQIRCELWLEDIFIPSNEGLTQGLVDSRRLEVPSP